MRCFIMRVSVLWQNPLPRFLSVHSAIAVLVELFVEVFALTHYPGGWAVFVIVLAKKFSKTDDPEYFAL